MMRHSGIGTYISELVPRIIDARPEYRFTLIGRPEQLAEVPWSRRPNVDVRACTAPIYGLAEQVALMAKIPRETSLFWAPHYNVPLTYGGRTAVTVHDVAHLALPQFVHGVHRRLYARAMFTAVRRTADALLCDSEFTAREFARLVGIGRAAPTTVHLGVDDRWFAVKQRERPHPRPFFLFIGNVKPNKNLRVLLRAFARILTQVPHDLVVVGRHEGLTTGDPDAVRDAASLGTRVRSTGLVSAEHLEQYVAFADALVMPSLYEGFGLPPLEAMAAGCPAVVSRAASLPEVCGDAALYFDAADASELADCLLRLASDASLRQRHCALGRRRAELFRWETCTTKTLAVLDPLVAR
ncbi:MAG TPA: glycosyltransferase family 1 protein [Gemmatimonadaceae bacterium]